MLKKNLSRDQIRLLRKVQKFIMAEPRRFNMDEGVRPANTVKGQLEMPPCGTTCCYAGAAFIIETGFKIDPLKPPYMSWTAITNKMDDLGFDGEMGKRLFYIQGLHPYQVAGKTAWPAFYAKAYFDATTPLQRASIGVARIEHFIATDGNE